MAFTSIKGQSLIDLATAYTAGYTNAIDPTILLQMLNEGKNEVWAILKGLRADYFMQSTTYALVNANATNYFAPMSTSIREYTLPADFQEIKFIEILDYGYEDTEFIYRDMASAQWKDLRRANTNESGQNLEQFQLHYDIIARGTLILAEYPPIAYQMPVLWYVRMLPDFDANDTLDQILYPFTSKIALYAAKLSMLTVQDQPMWQVWRDEWREGIKTVAGSAGPRQISDPQFVDSWDGNPSDGG